MNILRRHRLSRRRFLRGAGAALSLPLLETMTRARSATPPLRSVFVFVPGGVNVDEWTPRSTLKALAPIREHTLVLGGLNARQGETGANGHPLGTAPWLSSAPINDKDRGGYSTDITIDQFIANQAAGQTRLPSLELGCDADSKNMHYTNISWRGPASPMGKEFNPKDIYHRLFGDPRADVYRTSILDAVREDARRLRRQVSGLDREKLDEYFEAVRSVEKRIDFASRHQLKNPPAIDLPDGVPDNYLDHVNLLNDLLVLALQTDTTRVSSFMYNNEPGRNSWPEIGVRESHHGLAHLDPRTNEGRDKLRKLQRIDEAYLKIFVRFVQKLAAIREGEHSLLHHCQILYGSGLAWGRLHNRENLPVLLAGGAQGRITGGRHVQAAGTAFADVQLALLQNAGVRLERFADSKQPFHQLTA